jgi:hypothetical protein
LLPLTIKLYSSSLGTCYSSHEEHPKFNFSAGEVVVVISDDQDLYWIAEVTTADEENVALRYFHYTKNRENEKIWKLHNNWKLRSR